VDDIAVCNNDNRYQPEINRQKMPSVIIIYHFFYPDDVVSARHFSDLAEELANRGWKVTALTSNRFCRYPKREIGQRKEDWKGVQVVRVPRPGWNQANDIPRMANSLWMMGAWLLKLMVLPKADVMIVGSDPQFSQLLFPLIKLLRRAKILAFWCYDLYPEAILANGASAPVRWAARRLKGSMKMAYKSVDLIADLAPCMRRRLDLYFPKAVRATLTPWALVEPSQVHSPDPETRDQLFGPEAALTLLYSGNMGKAHHFRLFLDLARRVSHLHRGIVFCFACRGNRGKELKASIQPNDLNIRLAPFADESDLEKRLNSADIHLLSLQQEWEGIVLPSKFFGSLAVGRPVLYAGPKDSSIARWVEDLDIGLVLTADNLEEVARKLVALADNREQIKKWQEKALWAYQLNFSKKRVMDHWDSVLKGLLHGHTVVQN
jgi:glycosyltransferase involved in cell wall biosynthesis